MTWHPATILHRETFDAATPPWSDGKFDWSWVNKAFDDCKIKPMDFDGVIERFGNFLVIESKGPGVDIPYGQRLTLERFYGIGCATVLIVWGKLHPVKYQLWCANRFRDGRRQNGTSDCTPESLTSLIRDWRSYAETHRITTAA